LHHDVSALRPAVVHAAQVGSQSRGRVHVLPGAPVPHEKSRAQTSCALPLAIDPDSFTAIGVDAQTIGGVPASPPELVAVAPPHDTHAIAHAHAKTTERRTRVALMSRARE
jgi:hypothetical protein